MRGETTVSPVPSGAGRYQDWMWPDPLTLNGPNVGSGVRSRNFGGQPNLVQATTIAIGGGTNTVTAGWLGVSCAQLTSTNTPSGVAYKFETPMCNIRTSKVAIPPQCDDLLCYRMYCNMTMLSPVPQSDFGFEIVRTIGTTGAILLNLNEGFGVQLIDNTHCNFIVRGSNGLITTPFAVDCTAWHSFEFRIVGGMANTDATLQFLIDGVPQALPALSASWATGSNLPGTGLIGGLTGFTPMVIANAQVQPSGLFVQQARFICGPTMADCM